MRFVASEEHHCPLSVKKLATLTSRKKKFGNLCMFVHLELSREILEGAVENDASPDLLKGMMNVVLA
jgi:hypothetical protein